LGLQPVIRRIWAPIGDRPTASSHRKYEWLYVYAFVRPVTGDVFWLLLPTVNAQLFQRALEEFALWADINERKQVVLVIDNAGFHTAKKITLPEGIHLFYLPPYSPELQPAERLWTLVDEPVVNRWIKRIDDLENIIVERCRNLMTMPEVIRGRTLFNWWPVDAN